MKVLPILTLHFFALILTSKSLGTVFSPRNPALQFTGEIIRSLLAANLSPPVVNQDVFEQKLDGLLALYPEDPALGSPFNTGTETFGLDPSYKRLAAISMYIWASSGASLTVSSG